MTIGHPNLVALETINTCTRTCWFCEYGQRKKVRPVALMSWEVINRIVADLSGMDFSGRVSFYKINDPLCDKRLPTIIQEFSRWVPKAFTSVLTNSDLLTEEKANDLLSSGLRNLAVSIYDDQALDRCMKLRQSGVELTLLDRRTPSDFIENRGGNIDYQQGVTGPAKESRDQNCMRPSTGLNVMPNGDVVMCCVDFYGEVVMGNVLSNTIMEIWHGEAFNRLRKHLAEHGRADLPLCQQCDWWGGGHRVEWPVLDELDLPSEGPKQP